MSHVWYFKDPDLDEQRGTRQFCRHVSVRINVHRFKKNQAGTTISKLLKIWAIDFNQMFIILYKRAQLPENNLEFTPTPYLIFHLCNTDFCLFDVPQIYSRIGLTFLVIKLITPLLSLISRPNISSYVPEKTTICLTILK